jgi:hypothetical protein
MKCRYFQSGYRSHVDLYDLNQSQEQDPAQSKDQTFHSARNGPIATFRIYCCPVHCAVRSYTSFNTAATQPDWHSRFVEEEKADTGYRVSPST